MVSASQVFRRSVSRIQSNAVTFSRLEILWAIASFVVLLLCWDATTRLDQQVFPFEGRLRHRLAEEKQNKRREGACDQSSRPAAHQWARPIGLGLSG